MVENNQKNNKSEADEIIAKYEENTEKEKFSIKKMNSSIANMWCKLWSRNKDLNPNNGGDSKKRFHLKMISGFSILLILIALVIFVSWILHWTGTTVHTTDDDGNAITKAIQPLGIVDIFVEPFNGFMNTADIIIFLFVIGAFIEIVVVSKALEGSANAIINKLNGKEVYAIIPLMIFFSICGSVEGMCEESLGFYIICVPLMIMAGFDKITGFLVVFLGAGVGVLTATVDPFAVSTAVKALNIGAAGQGYSNLFTEGTGLIWRFVSWIVLTSFAITYVMIRAMKIRNNPQRSIVFKTMDEDKKFFLSVEQEKIVMDWRKKITITIFLLAFLIMILYIIPWSQLGIDVFEKSGIWVNEHMYFITSQVPGLGSADDNFPIIGAFFLIASIVLGLVNGLGEEKFLYQFMSGARGILSVSLIVAISAGLNQSLTDSNIKWLVVSGIGDALNGIDSDIAKIILIFIIFIGISMLIPSTSGFANAVLPLMINALVVTKNGTTQLNSIAPNTILAFVMANGFVNLFTPLSAVIFGGLEISRIDYGDFWRFMWKILLAIFVICLIMLIIGTALTSSGILPAAI